MTTKESITVTLLIATVVSICFDAFVGKLSGHTYYSVCSTFSIMIIWEYIIRGKEHGK